MSIPTVSIPAVGRAERPLAVIGIGNVLMGDDAAGVRVIESLRELVTREPDVLPPGTRLVDGGTTGLDLLGVVADCDGLVIVDAVRLGGPTGTVVRLRHDAIQAWRVPDFRAPAGGIDELLAVAGLMGWLPDALVLVGIEAAGIDPGMELSRPVREALPAAVDAVRDELNGMERGVATRQLAGAMA